MTGCVQKTMQQIQGFLEVVNEVFLFLQSQQHSCTKLLGASPSKWILLLLSDMKCVQGEPLQQLYSVQNAPEQRIKCNAKTTKSPRQKRVVKTCGRPGYVEWDAQKTGEDECLQKVVVNFAARSHSLEHVTLLVN